MGRAIYSSELIGHAIPSGNLELGKKILCSLPTHPLPRLRQAALCPTPRDASSQMPNLREEVSWLWQPVQVAGLRKILGFEYLACLCPEPNLLSVSVR